MTTQQVKPPIPDSVLPPLPPEPMGAAQQMPEPTVEGRVHRTEGQANKSQEEKTVVQEISAANNPASTSFGVTAESRVSMNVPERQLEVPEIEGFHLHWFLETNLHKAVRAGYEYVSPGEVPTMDRSIGGRSEGSESEDLGGGRIAHIAGQAADGRPLQLVLMKIRCEWYFEDQRKIAARNRQVLDMIFKKKQPIREPGEKETDFQQRYTREAAFDMSNGRFRKT
jgi:hypothetical protein